jgi:hypothetical protein
MPYSKEVNKSFKQWEKAFSIAKNQVLAKSQNYATIWL